MKKVIFAVILLLLLFPFINQGVVFAASVYDNPEPIPYEGTADQKGVIMRQDNPEPIPFQGTPAQQQALQQSSSPAIANPINANSFSALFQQMMSYFKTIAGSIAVLFIIIGGVMYMASGGNKAVMERAKNTLVYAIVGLTIVVAAPLFLSDVLMILKGGGGSGTSGLLRVATNVLRILLSIVGVLGIMGLMNAGVIMFVSSGYEDQMKAARKALSYSLIGIALAGGSLVLIKTMSVVILGG